MMISWMAKKVAKNGITPIELFSTERARTMGKGREGVKNPSQGLGRLGFEKGSASTRPEA